MKDTTSQINDILKNQPVLIFFSTGKDSIVMADLLQEYSGQKEYVFLYFVEGLSIKQRIIEHYEKRWNCKIHQYPHFANLSLKTGKKYKMADIEHGLRAKFNISWIAQGYKKTDSMARRGMLAHLPYGIDDRNKKLYPIADLTDKQVMSYIKLHKLPLPIEYQYGVKHDISSPDAKMMLFIKNNFPDDYRKITAEFPKIKSLVWAEEN